MLSSPVVRRMGALFREKETWNGKMWGLSYIRMTLYKYNKVYGDKPCESLPIRNLSCAGNSKLF